MFKKNGFTLLEILIVAALISLLSGIAMISIQTLFRKAQINVTRGEVSQIYKAESFCYEDTGVYVKFHVLGVSKSELNDPSLFPYFSGTGMNYLNYIGFPMTNRDVRNILEGWNGPYWGVSKSRNNKPIPVNAQGLYDPNGKFLLPIDPFGNPYVMYLLVKDSNPIPGYPAPDTNGVRPIISPDESPDYLCAIVSYGPNGVPGADVGEDMGNGDRSGDDDGIDGPALPLDNSSETSYWNTYQSYRELGYDDIIIKF